jgi:hypothetical protein
MAPKEDLLVLKILTDHELAAIDFAKREIAGDLDSVESLNQYLKRKRLNTGRYESQ